MDGPAEGGGQAVEDAPDERRPGGRGRLVEAAAGGRDPRRHVAGRQEGRVVGVDDRSAGRQLAGRDEERRQVLGVPSSSQARSDSWSSHSPMTLRR